jgi:hypothetical protein
MSIAPFLAFMKSRQGFVLIDHKTSNHGKVLYDGGVPFLDQMFAVLTAMG